MTIQKLRDNNQIILECISGSKAYGLDTPASDTDIRGVFLAPQREIYGMDYTPQVSDATNDTVFYELGRFMELLALNNPNILELLNTPPQAVIYKHPFLAEIKSEMILSKLCENTFGKFAYSQIKKAKGLKKKIVNPMHEKRKTVLEFCYVNYAQGAIPAAKYLELQGWKQEDCGLVNIAHMKDVYGLYHSEDADFRGIMTGEKANDVCLSSVPKGSTQAALLYFNREGYSVYCKDYREYWSWVEKRNEARYRNTESHGKKYDAKNMMHVFRLLDTAIEIGRTGQVNVRRPNRDFLLKIKSGAFEYDDLLTMAEEKKTEMEAAFAASDLPEQPDRERLNELLFELRSRFYENC